jgi:hypothetical protein
MCRFSCLDAKAFEVEVKENLNLEDTANDECDDSISETKMRSRPGNFAYNQWELEKIHDPELTASVPTMEELLEFTGLEKVKMSVIDLFRRIALSKLRGSIGSDIPLNFRFVGNPGTGML